MLNDLMTCTSSTCNIDNCVHQSTAHDTPVKEFDPVLHMQGQYRCMTAYYVINHVDGWWGYLVQQQLAVSPQSTTLKQVCILYISD